MNEGAAFLLAVSDRQFLLIWAGVWLLFLLASWGASDE